MSRLPAEDRDRPADLDDLLVRAYSELKAVAHSKLRGVAPGQSITATDLVHEAWLKLERRPDPLEMGSRGEFFATLGTLMRNALVDRIRSNQALKRGGDRRRDPISASQLLASATIDDYEVVEAAIERLRREDERAAELVVLRFFCGMTHEEAATALGCSERTLRRDWAFARAWLHREFSTESE